MKIDIAKFKILKERPLYGKLLYYLNFKREDSIETLGVDGDDNLYYNQGYWDSLKGEEQKFVLCHEVMHLALKHLWREKAKDHVKWNIACDYAINQLIDYSPPKNILLSGKYINKCAEEIYKLLKDKKQKGFDNHSKWGDKSEKKNKIKGKSKGEIETTKEKQDKWDERTQTAVKYSEGKQKGTGSILKGLGLEFLDEYNSYKDILLRYVDNKEDDYDFYKADRRFLDQEYILPSFAEKEVLNWIAIIIDTSGSISHETLWKFITDVRGIINEFDEVKVKLAFADDQVSKFYDINKIEDIPQCYGGGGTDFRPAIAKVNKMDNAPKALFYFTDGYGDFPRKEDSNGYDTYWVITELESFLGEKITVPYGELLKFKD